MKRLLIASLLCLTSATQHLWAGDNDWPTWRGPNYTGASPDAKPPIEWSQEKNIQWKAPIPGKGSSTPIVWGNQVFILSAEETDRVASTSPIQEQSNNTQSRFVTTQPPGGGRRPPAPPPTKFYRFLVLSYDLRTGEKLWQSTATEEVPHESGHSTNNFASSSPVTDGKVLYAFFGSRGIFAYDLNGKKLWEKDLGQQETRNQFGEGGSPALYQDYLIIPWDHEGQSFIAALDAKTGEIRWKVDRDEKTGWATPLIVEHKGRVQVVTNGKRIRSYDLKDGKLIWECGGQTDNPIPSPILYGDQIIATTGFRGAAMFSISLDSTGDVTDNSTSVKWKGTEATPYVPSPTLYKDRVYFVKSNNAILSSVDAKTGKIAINQKRLEGLEMVYSSIGAANDHIYVTDRNGTTLVLKHGDELQIVASNRLEEEIDASPVFLGNRLLLRSDRHLYCIANPK